MSTAARRAAPGLMADRARRYERGVRLRVGMTSLGERFAAAHGDRVLHGPLAGLRLVAERLAEIDAPVARLLGTYELEIQPALRAAIDARPSRFVDVGCADGYYAVGVARAAGVAVDAFDLARSARSLTRATARLNGVEGAVALHGRASALGIAALALDGALVLCDIEGGERDLLTPALVRRLAGARVIVELHAAAAPDVEDVLVDRFAATHETELVRAVPRRAAEHPELAIFDDPDERAHAIDELRYRSDGQGWLIAVPR